MKKILYLTLFVLVLISALTLSACMQDSHEHEYEAEVTKATCTQNGYTVYKCECGDFYKDDYTGLGDHTFGEWVNITDATCTSDGQKKRDCALCNYTESEVIKAGGHSYTESVVSPTCQEKGYTAYTCACGDTYNGNYVDEVGHDFDEWYDITTPGCLSEGEKQRDCKNCDKFETDVSAATGHSFTENVVKPTCEARGYTEYTCECGYSTTGNYVDATGHSYGDWYNISEPGCLSDGEKRRNCANCEKFETGTIEPKGHTYEPTVVPPTCEEDGYTKHYCECGDSYNDTIVDALGHTFDQKIADSSYLKSVANCKNKALYYYSCKCGAKGSTTFEDGELGNHVADAYGWCVDCNTPLTVTPTSGLTYMISDDGKYAILIGASDYVRKNVTKITVAETYQGVPVTTIGLGGAYENPFQKCEKLTHVYIPEGVTTISGNAFKSCANLTNVVLPSTVTFIGASAFESSKKLESIVIPDGVTEILDYTFRYCEGLKKVDLGAGVTRIEKLAFYECKALESITIPDNVTYIAEMAFSDCYSLKTLSIGTALTFIGSFAFDSCSSLEELTIPHNVGQINSNAFQYCTSLHTVTMTGNNITSIEDSMFYGCTSLTTVKLGNKLSRINPHAFGNCPLIYNEKDGLNYLGSEENPYLYLMGPVDKTLTSATIDSTCKVIYANAFRGCTNLTEVVFTNGKNWYAESIMNKITASTLSNAATAATYLTSTYVDKCWFIL